MLARLYGKNGAYIAETEIPLKALEIPPDAIFWHAGRSDGRIFLLRKRSRAKSPRQGTGLCFFEGALQYLSSAFDMPVRMGPPPGKSTGARPVDPETVSWPRHTKAPNPASER